MTKTSDCNTVKQTIYEISGKLHVAYSQEKVKAYNHLLSLDHIPTVDDIAEAFGVKRKAVLVLLNRYSNKKSNRKEKC